MLDLPLPTGAYQHINHGIRYTCYPAFCLSNSESLDVQIQLIQFQKVKRHFYRVSRWYKFLVS